VLVLFPEEAGLAAIAERKRPEDRTEEDKMALLGRPRLGDIIRAQIRVKESKEFKVRISLSNCG
jgi:solute carrier family 8 (sodium/calcium exchanger)